MFGIFSSAQKRARHDAQNWLHLASKVYHFRRDQLPVQEIEALQLSVHELRTRLKERADAARLKMGIEKLEGCLRRSGGTFYPKSSMVDNVEFFLVAMILFLGVRAFIVQPFKIPTNSMWPTYHGLTAEVYVDASQAAADTVASLGTIQLRPRGEEPGAAGAALRWLVFGASARRVDAPVDGEIFVPFVYDERLGVYAGPVGVEIVKARKWLVFPDEAKRYTLYVGQEPVTVTVPTDFRYDLLLTDVFFQDRDTMDRALAEARSRKRVAKVPVTVGGPNNTTRVVQADAYLLATGQRVRAGERALSFDVMTGDQLFVDRVSYHFVAPEVGDGFVFRTHHIPFIEQNREFSDKYYIKRLVGTPGDVIEIRPPVLHRNGAPITGATAFGKNAGREDGFPGYTLAPSNSKIFTTPGGPVTVPSRRFLAMGDNSTDSADSRSWGFVPADDVIGRPLWVYFPFTRRWGPAR